MSDTTTLYDNIDIERLLQAIRDEYLRLEQETEIPNSFVLVVSHSFLEWCYEQRNLFLQFIEETPQFQIVSNRNQHMPLIRGIMLGGNLHFVDDRIEDPHIELKTELTDDAEVHFHLKDFTIKE